MPSGVFKGLRDVSRLKGRKFLKQFSHRRPIGKVRKYDYDGDPHASDAGAAAHDRAVEGYPIELVAFHGCFHLLLLRSVVATLT